MVWTDTQAASLYPSRTKRRAELLAPCWYFFPCLTAGVVRAGAPVLVRLRPLPFLRSSVVEEDK